ncbi:MAG: two-component regulator propeller domain-containing protein [Acidobacteriota bacterium]
MYRAQTSRFSVIPKLAGLISAVALGWLIQASGVYAEAPPLDPAKRISQYVLDVWNTQDGLPSNTIRGIAQTADGYLWLTTPGGLVRFNGLDFQTFDTSNTPAFLSENFGPLTTGPDGSLWIGSLGAGLYRFREGAVTHIMAQRDLANSINALHIDSAGVLWVATEDGLYRLGGGVLQEVELPGDPPISVIALAEDTTGAIWASTRFQETLLVQIEGDQVVPTPSPAPLLGPIYALHHEPAGLWIATSQGLARADERGVATYTRAQGLAFNVVRSLYRDRGDSLWIGTDNGLNRVRDGRFESLRTDDGLPDGRLRCIFEDREGSLWIGTYAGGLVRLKEGSITSYAQSEGMAANIVWSISEDPDKNLWIGTSGGVNRLTPQETLPPLPGLDDTIVFSARVSADGELWAGTLRGLVQWNADGGRRFTTREGLWHDLVKAVYPDPQAPGDVWVGTQSGLNLYRDGAIHRIERVVGTVHDLLRDRSNALWVTTESGLFRLDGSVLSGERSPGHVASITAIEPTVFTMADGLLSNSFRSLYEDAAGTLWIGSYGGGLIRYRNEAFASLTARDGLLTSNVWGILEDDHANLWLSNDDGIQRIAKRDIERYLEDRSRPLPVQRFGLGDGMKNIECNSQGAPAAWRGSDGRLWFPTMRGAVAIDPGRSRRQPAVLSTVIESVRVEGKSLLLSDSVILQPDQRDIAIRYAAISLRDPERLRFRYRLRGFDSTWRDAGTRRDAFYTNLPPGSYRFQIQAGSDGRWHEPGATLSFQRLPRITEQVWFRVLIALLAGSLVYLLYRYQVHRIQRRSLQLQTVNHKLASTVEELEAKNAELERYTYTVSHDLKNPLLTILGFAGVIKQKTAAGQNERIDGDLDRITSAARTMHQLLDDLLELSRVGQVVGPSETIELDELVGEAMNLLQEALAQGGVEASVARRLPPVVGDRARLLEVFQNLIENAIKFMGDQASPRVEITAERQGSEVVCTVRDNGIGIAPEYQDRVFGLFERLEPSVQGTGVGLALVKRIVEVHGGRIRLESAGVGAGCTFTFTLPAA